MMKSKRREIITVQNSNILVRMWNSFMTIVYVLYSLLTFFACLFGVVFILYHAFYKVDYVSVVLGIVVTWFMSYLNMNVRPK